MPVHISIHKNLICGPINHMMRPQIVFRCLTHVTRHRHPYTTSAASRRHSPSSPTASASPSTSAQEAASRMLDEFSDFTVLRRQTLDANQLHKLLLTLGQTTLADRDISENPPPVGTPIPPGHHLVYFTPLGTEADLGPDGSDKTFNAPSPFTRRMWAGGKMKWPQGSDMLLRVGDVVEELTRLVSVTPKKSKVSGDMVLVEVEKEICGPNGIGVIDRRSWIFRPEIDPAHVVSSYETYPKHVPRLKTTIENASPQEIDSQYPGRRLCWSPVGLFRFSSLTFNSHMIHFNEAWSQAIEGHPGVVVHGPLNLINILNYWRDVHGAGCSPSSITYRALAPLYAGDTYLIKTNAVSDAENRKVFEIVAEKDGVICMKSEVRANCQV